MPVFGVEGNPAEGSVSRQQWTPFCLECGSCCLGAESSPRLRTSCQEKSWWWDLSNSMGFFGKQGSCAREGWKWQRLLQARAGAVCGTWGKCSGTGSLPEGFICSCQVYAAAGNLMLVQLWTEVPSLQLWPVPALTKWVEALWWAWRSLAELLQILPFQWCRGREGQR